uniref:Uncharacterized protein n=1 Tax=Arundo donax TaxID=35708 RepID=A0A0A9GYW9_ARUDO
MIPLWEPHQANKQFYMIVYSDLTHFLIVYVRIWVWMGIMLKKTRC